MKLMENLTSELVSKHIDRFLDDRDHVLDDRNHDHRYASFDYCFNYFHNLKEEGRIRCINNPDYPTLVEQTCMQLAFFLASWGMLRGGTILLWKSASFYRRVLAVIARCEDGVWDIDLPYSDNDIRLLIRVGQELREALWTEDEAREWFSARLPDGEKLSEGKTLQASNTLVTKIMLGVFANVCAFEVDPVLCTRERAVSVKG